MAGDGGLGALAEAALGAGGGAAGAAGRGGWAAGAAAPAGRGGWNWSLVLFSVYMIAFGGGLVLFPAELSRVIRSMPILDETPEFEGDYAFIGAFFLIYLGIFYLKAGVRNDSEFAWDSIKCRAGILPILFGSLVLSKRINRGFLLLVPLDLMGALWTWATLP